MVLSLHFQLYKLYSYTLSYTISCLNSSGFISGVVSFWGCFTSGVVSCLGWFHFRVVSFHGWFHFWGGFISGVVLFLAWSEAMSTLYCTGTDEDIPLLSAAIHPRMFSCRNMTV